MKICFICPEYPPGPHGGVGSVTQILARALVKHGHSVRVIGIYSPRYQAPAYEEDEGVRVWRIHEPRHRLGWMRARYQMYRTVRQWANNGEIDIVESPDSYGWLAGWPKLPVPVILRSHGSRKWIAWERGESLSRVLSTLELWSHRRSDSWAVVSQYVGDMTQKLFDLPYHPQAVLYNPIELKTLPAFSHRKAGRVVFTGTLTHKKGIISLVRAWPTVKEQIPEAELLVFGKDRPYTEQGTMQTYLPTLLPETMQNSVTFHGHVERQVLLEALATARAAVFPSYVEAFGMAALEAMSCGCPTIFTRRTSGPEVVRDGLDGLLIDPDNPQEIAEAIIRLLTDDTLARKLGDGGYRWVEEQFTLERLLPLNEQFFADVIQSFNKGRNEYSRTGETQS